MTDVIFTHSYTNTSCLQVFLYTDIDNLFKEAAFFLSKSSHQEPLFAIVASHKQKEALLSQLYHQNGFTSFFHIETLQDTLQILLQKYCGYKEVKIHDTLSLTLAIYELILKKDPAVSFLNFSNYSNEDIYLLAKEVAGELQNIFQVKPNIDNPKIVNLIFAIKQLHSDIFFEKEALELCHLQLERCVFIGFHFLPNYYIELLEQGRSQAFLLVPSLAFLGDILSPKQRLKRLQKAKEALDPLFEFNEHPLLENLSLEAKMFFLKISEIEQLYIQEEEFDNSNQTSLEQLQTTLIHGYFDKKIEKDGSIKFFEIEGPYQQSCLFFSQLQEFYKEELSLKQTDIAVIGDKRIYGPIFEAISKNFIQEEIKSRAVPNNIGLIFLELLNTDYKEQNQNFFIKFFENIYYFSDDEKKIDIKNALLIIKNAHFSDLQSLSRGKYFLQELQNAFLRSTIFDINDDEASYEYNFIKKSENIELDKVLIIFSEICDLIESCEDLKNKTLLIQDWVLSIAKVVNTQRETFEFQYDFISKLIKYFAKSFHFKVLVPFFVFVDLLKDYVLHDYEKNEGFWTFFNPSELVNFKSKVTFVYLTDKDHIKKSSFFGVDISKFNTSIYFLLNTESKLIFIKEKEEGNFCSTAALNLWYFSKSFCMANELDDDLLYRDRKPIINKKEFFNQEALDYIKNIQLNKEKYTLEFDFVRKFIDEPSECIKSKILRISNYAQLIDLDVRDRFLLTYKLQLEANKWQGNINLDGFKSLKPAHNQKSVFFTKFTSHTDELTGLEVIAAVENLIKDNYTVSLVGSMIYENREKIYRNHDKIDLCLKIEQTLMQSMYLQEKKI